MKTAPSGVVEKSEGYLIFRVENGRLENCGLYETRAAAERRMAAMGLSAEWKIAAIDCWFQATPNERAKKGKR
jgi:hypothetical protein